MPGAGTVGFDRLRLEHLRRATDEAIATTRSVRLDDGHAIDAMQTVQMAGEFLAGPWRAAITSTLATWQLEREIAGRIGSAVDRFFDASTGDRRTLGPACQLRFAHLATDDLLGEFLDRLTDDGGQHALASGFWSRYGDDALDELHARLLADPELLHHLADMPAMVPLFGLLLPRRDLPSDVRLAIALAVTSTPAIGALAETPLHRHTTAIANGVVTLTSERPIESVADIDLLVAVLRSGDGDHQLLGRWVGTTVDDLRSRDWPPTPTIGLTVGLAQFAGLGTLSETDPPPELVGPTSTVLAAAVPLLAAGRDPHGSFYPTADADRSDAPALDRADLEDLIGAVLTDSDAAATLFVGLRAALADAFTAEHRNLAVERIDEIARIVDESAQKQQAELTAIAAARAEWIDRMIGLGGVGTAGRRYAGAPGAMAAGFVVGQVEELLTSFVDVEQLPIEDIRSYYEKSRRFEQLRADIAAADDPVLAAKLGDVADRMATLAEGLDSTASIDADPHRVDAINTAYLDVEDAAAGLIDWSLPTMNWNEDR